MRPPGFPRRWTSSGRWCPIDGVLPEFAATDRPSSTIVGRGYSRVGFAHQYRPLGNDELLFVLQRHWRALGKALDPEDFTDAQAIAAIARVTRGNFRLLERLFPQIERVMKINQLDSITNDVVEAAQSTLVFGVA